MKNCCTLISQVSYQGAFHYLEDPWGMEFSNQGIKNSEPLPSEVTEILYPSYQNYKKFRNSATLIWGHQSSSWYNFFRIVWMDFVKSDSPNFIMLNFRGIIIWGSRGVKNSSIARSRIPNPSHQRWQEFCTPSFWSVRNSIPLPKNSIPPGSPK